MLSGDNIESLMQLYGSAGMRTSEILFVMDVLMYVLPSLLALWATGGVLASGAAVKLMNRRKGVELQPTVDISIRMGLVPAWILIAALAVNLAGSGFLQRAAVNISIFMILPYSAVGVAVCRKALLMYPQGLMLAILAGVIFPPLALGVLMITGILDTWFDFRLRLKGIYERKNQ